jgi:hypothetical protein
MKGRVVNLRAHDPIQERARRSKAEQALSRDQYFCREHLRDQVAAGIADPKLFWISNFTGISEPSFRDLFFTLLDINVPADHELWDYVLDEIARAVYPEHIMDTAEAITAARAILSRVFPAERVGKALEDLATGGESAGTDDPATVEPRPAQAAVKVSAPAEPPKLAAMEWPTAKWKDATEKILGKKRGIITFLEREWEPFIQNTGKVVTRDILASHDPDAEQALTRHLETHEFPEKISIIYPERLMQLAAERPELLRALFSVHGMGDMR